MSGYNAIDGDFNEHVGSTETSFEDFLNAIGAEAAPAGKADEEYEEHDMSMFGEDDVEENEDFSEDDDDQFDPDAFEDEDEDSDEEEESEEAEEGEEELEEDVDFGELEIDMDSEIQIGEEFVTINDLIKNRLTTEALVEKEEELNEIYEDLTSKTEAVTTTLEKAILECDKVIEDYKTFDWKKLAAEDPSAYAQHREFLEAYLARKDEIEVEYTKAKDMDAERATAARNEQAVHAVRVLTTEIPGWDEALYGQLMGYAIENLGMDKTFVTESMDVGFFKTVHNVMKRDKELNAAVAKVRKPMVKKVASSKSAAPKTAVKKSVSKKAAAPSAGEVGVSSYDKHSYNAFSKLGIK